MIRAKIPVRFHDILRISMTRRYLRLVLALGLVTALGLAAQNQEAVYAAKRREMVDQQLRARDITDPKVLKVMGEIPRHLFVDPESRGSAYDDRPLPIADGQTISQPYIVALMTQCLKVGEHDKILEVGTGSGYQAAVLARLGARVFSIEIKESLAKQAATVLAQLGETNVRVKCGDGYFGWPDEAPFDAVIVTCAANHVPDPLFAQLKEGGRLIIPVGKEGEVQTLTLYTKIKGMPRPEKIIPVFFVPMTGTIKK
jgi:protein-L-isoaspartate(D-aspartate) O-methyltransferase